MAGTNKSTRSVAHAKQAQAALAAAQQAAAQAAAAQAAARSAFAQPRVAPYASTHEGAPTWAMTPSAQLRRAVAANMLWEDTFYESGVSIADRIKALIDPATGIPAAEIAQLARDARTAFKLRHVPLLLVRELARRGENVEQVLADVIQRPDELAEFVSLWLATNAGAKNRKTLSASAKRGLARAFQKFSPYQLAKYNRDAQVKLRDVLFLCHAKPAAKIVDRAMPDGTVEATALWTAEEQAAVWQQLIDGTLAAPDTWEVALSAGADKRATFERLIAERALGALALLRNLRNMVTAGVPDATIRAALADCNTDRVLPFRFITAARHAPTLADALEALMLRALADQPKFAGRTALLIDGSGSMQGRTSGQSEVTCFDTAAALAILLNEVCEDQRFYVFSYDAHRYQPRDAREPTRGFALADGLRAMAQWGGTNTEAAVRLAAQDGYDRVIILTDEQSHTPISAPLFETRAYVINVAAYQHGIGYGDWLHVDGWSEAVLDFIRVIEAMQAAPPPDGPPSEMAVALPLTQENVHEETINGPGVADVGADVDDDPSDAESGDAATA